MLAFLSLCCGPHPILSPSCVSWELGTERVALSSAPLVAETLLCCLCSLGLAGCGLGVKCQHWPYLFIEEGIVLHIPKASTVFEDAGFYM